MPADMHRDAARDEPFATLVSAYLDELFSDRPALATFQGWDGLDDRSPDLSATAITGREQRREEWLGRFDELADAGLSAEQRIDRDLAVAVLRGEQITRGWQEWRRTPDYYLGSALMGVFSLFLRR